MAVNEPRIFFPKLPEHVERDAIKFSFDRISDTLVIFYQYPPTRPTVNVPTSEYEYLRVDAETEEVVGMQVEDFLSYAIYRNWVYLQYAALAGLSREEIAALHERVERALGQQDAKEQRLALVTDTLRQMRFAQHLR